MSHELRTPLNAILGFGQLLQLDDLAEEQAESVDHILRAVGGALTVASVEGQGTTFTLELSLAMEPV